VITEKNLEANGSIAAVIDGMGGLGGGDVAATWLAHRWAKRRVSSKAALKRQLCRDHEALNDEARGSPTPLMGAVATGIALLPEYALLFHVGDCRAYPFPKSPTLQAQITAGRFTVRWRP
jgi:serine/threonine protein phosphatase PrpC